MSGGRGHAPGGANDEAAQGGARPTPAGRVVAALGLASFLSLLNQLALGPFLPVMAADLRTSVALLGQVPALSTLVAAALGLAIGPLADRLGHRRALLSGLAALGAGALGVALAPSYPVVLGVALVGALGRATIGPVAQALAGARFAGETRRRALGWVVAGTSGAGVVGIPLLTAIAAALGWRAAFGGLALLVAAGLLLAWRAIERDRLGAPAAPGPRALLAGYGPLLRHRPTLALVGASVLSAMGIWTTWTYLGAFYVQVHGFTTQGAGWVYMLASLGVLPGSLAAGGRLGRLPARPLLIGSRLLMGLLLAAPLALPVGAPVSVGLLAVSSTMLGIGAVMINALLIGETPAGRATTMAFNQSAMSLGAAVGSAAGGAQIGRAHV